MRTPSPCRGREPLLWICIGSLALALGAGCASTGYQKSDATAKSLQAAAHEAAVQSNALEVTMETLTSLVNDPPADLKPAYATFVKHLGRLEASARRTAATAQRMVQLSTNYFHAWDNQLSTMHYEVVRNNSQARREEVQRQFDLVDKRYQEVQGVVIPLITYLRDIRSALSTDLTMDGLAAVKPVVENARVNSDKVKVALGNLQEALLAASSRMSSVQDQVMQQ